MRAALVAGYVAVVALAFVPGWGAWQPRLFWTVLLPLFPLSLVLAGFASWRRVCPLAFWGELGRSFNRGRQRRVPAWVDRAYFPAVFALMLAMLALRHLATNGDPLFLGGLFVALAAGAAATNRVFTGKTWCNYVCPVGLVELVYTEPTSLRPGPNSECAKCTACKRHCPDIDEENAFWKDLTGPGRRFAYYAFPGLVLGFYVYFWLRYGDWEAYFDGRWTRAPAGATPAFGPGLFFAPGVPALIAAPLALAAFSAASYGIFRAAEAALRRSDPDPERVRHRLFALAAFAAFNFFYLFAGAPTLRQLPGGVRLVAFAAPLVATLFLVKRWRRSHTRYVQERSAARLLKNWPFDEPPPAELGEVFAYYRARAEAREKSLGAYRKTIREMLQEGIVTPDELKLLGQVRSQLGITSQEHARIVAELGEEERKLFEGDGGIAARLQMGGYEKALAAALLRRATPDEVERLREEHAVTPEAHLAALERVRGGAGPLAARARHLVAEIAAIRSDLVAVRSGEGAGEACAFLAFALLKAQERAVKRLVEVLEVGGDAAVLERARPRLFAPDPRDRAAAAAEVAAACARLDAGLREAVERLRPAVLDPEHRAAAEAPSCAPVLKRLLASPDPYLRAGAAAALSSIGPDDRSTLERMLWLHRVPLFHDLDLDALQELSRVTSEETASAGESLCLQGEPGDDLFVIVEGRASVLVDGVPPREIAVRGPGDVVGELAVIDGGPRSATVRPKDGEVRYLRIDGRAFRGRVLHRPDLWPTLMSTLARRLREAAR